MPADSSLIPREPPGWYLVTDQGVVLSVRFDSPEPAEAYRRRFLLDLRRDLQRARKPGPFIAERVRAVRVGYGVLVGAWCGFEQAPPP
jgi:hypothetical protein